MDNCVFCKIIKGELESKKIYEDEFVLAFLTHGPVSDGHLLVIPKEHCENILDISTESLNKVMAVAKMLALQAIQAGATGVNVLHAAGQDAQQSVFHFHIHVVPRNPNDGLDLWYQAKIEKK